MKGDHVFPFPTSRLIGPDVIGNEKLTRLTREVTIALLERESW